MLTVSSRGNLWFAAAGERFVALRKTGATASAKGMGYFTHTSGPHPEFKRTTLTLD